MSVFYTVTKSPYTSRVMVSWNDGGNYHALTFSSDAEAQAWIYEQHEKEGKGKKA
jgi:hypothetical protein